MVLPETGYGIPVEWEQATGPCKHDARANSELESGFLMQL